MDSGFSLYTSLSGSLDHSCFVVATPIVIDGAPMGAVIAVEDVLVGLLPYVKSITKMFLLSGLISLFIAFIASYVFSYGVSKPLSEMTVATKEFAKGKFSVRVREEHKKGEMRLLAQALNKMANDLEIEDAAKKSFVANVSHELKTPMTTIGGFIDGILDGTIPEDRQREYLSTVSSEVKRLARLVVAMLNLSKIESGETKLTPIEYDILPQLFETMLSFEPVIEKNSISIEGFETLEGIKICADKDLLHQVLYNLVDNAVKFTPENGVITLYADYNERRTRIAIRNSGAGVAEEEIKHIFERFYKVDKSRSYDVKGVGLGLYIVKTIINMHGGTISADSKLNEYTEFSFTIPFNKQQ
ncbi:MAG: HAMP domain-containing histidine kinase [Clostridia bacterium]|nr:HAMP domain-containing histidine kinase [Clostridia bacterium]